MKWQVDHTSRVRKYVLLVLAFLQAGLTSGVIYGWPAIEDIFTQKGIHNSCGVLPPGKVCQDQAIFFNLIYTVATFANNLEPVFVGVFLDKFGPRLTNLVSTIVFMGGCALFLIPGEKMIIVAYAMLGFAGPGIYVSLMHISNLFPGYNSTILSAFSGCFTVSSFVFRIFEMIYGKYTYNEIWLGYILVLAPLFIPGIFIWPSKSYQLPPEALKEDHEKLLPKEVEYARRRRLTYDVSFKQQISSSDFWVMTLWLAINSLHVNSYIGSLNSQFVSVKAQDYPTYFNWIWSLGFCVIPVVGLLLDKMGTTFAMFVTSVSLLIYRITAIIPSLRLQIFTFVDLSLAHVALWAVFYSLLSKRFGFKHYGALVGTASTVVAIIGSLQLLFFFITLNYLKQDFFWVNMIFVPISIILLYPARHLRRVKSSHKRLFPITSYRGVNHDSSRQTEEDDDDDYDYDEAHSADSYTTTYDSPAVQSWRHYPSISSASSSAKL
eukprot:TRINITY_DN7196_c0_g1_i2.p1 TRINITY_DN7196_c0_g1~~TRINITY_DN7196_c0_g1_i2.p1  ORF type:complete len:492 (+),score=61.53 TRINITY_DN7196_c0_g1_i2:213-1688(+)